MILKNHEGLVLGRIKIVEAELEEMRGLMSEADSTTLIHYIERMMTIVECLNRMLKDVYSDHDKNPFTQ